MSGLAAMGIGLQAEVALRHAIEQSVAVGHLSQLGHGMARVVPEGTSSHALVLCKCGATVRLSDESAELLP